MGSKCKRQSTGVVRARRPAYTILNRFNAHVEHLFQGGKGNTKRFPKNSSRESSIREKASHGEAARRHDTTSPLALPPQEQPVKSNSAAVEVAPAVTFNGMAAESLLVV